MSIYGDPPFSLGQTFGPTTPNDSLVSTSIASGAYWAGHLKVFTDFNPLTGAIRSARQKKCVIVRNSSGITLQAKKLVMFKSGSQSEVDGYAALTDAVPAGVVDEYLTSGVANGDWFWITVEGPTEISLGAANNCAIDTDIVAVTAAGSTNTTAAGRAQTVSTTTVAQLRSLVGKALSAATTAANVLCHVALPRS